MPYVKWFNEVGIADVEEVGGKNASLGEMYQQLDSRGVSVPNGFATTSEAFRQFLAANGLEEYIAETLDGLDPDDVDDLQRRAKAIRTAIRRCDLPDELKAEITAAYRQLSEEAGVDMVDVAVRSSATAEDLPEASFAGQQETFLMIHGDADVHDAILKCFASLYNTRAVSYRIHMGIDETGIALSACIQRMVRSDKSSSGVIFTLDTDSGFPDVVYVTSCWGLGENIVQGKVVPDSFYVHKQRLRDGFEPLVGRRLGAKEQTMAYDEQALRITNDPTPQDRRDTMSISDAEVLQLARWSLVIEDHYTEHHGRPTPMDIEWAKDGITGDLFIVQARPETVHSRTRGSHTMKIHNLTESGTSLVDGLAVGKLIAHGTVRNVTDPQQMNQVEVGDVLVTEMTDPDWEPVMKRAAALVTERGGRTSHAAIVARELGIPAIVGTGPIDGALADGHRVTVSCAEGEVGHVYDGELAFEIEEIDFDTLPEVATTINLNVGDPSLAFTHAQLPADGIGLARMEFIFASHVGVHPLALTRPEELTPVLQREVDAHTVGYDDKREYLIDILAQGVGTLAAAFWPRPVLLRFSDFKSNEYATLLGGECFEPFEPNPMIGWRGASRYHHPDYRDGFELELAAVRRVREDMGFTNLKVMVPFCRTPEEGRLVLDVLAEGGLVRGENGLEVYVMAEIPSNVFCAPEYAELFDGFSIGSNDLTQLVLGVDRDSESVSDIFDERHPAVTRAITHLITSAHALDRKIGICGQAPSDHPEFAAFLVDQGIDSISVTPDALGKTIQTVAEVEAGTLRVDLATDRQVALARS